VAIPSQASNTRHDGLLSKLVPAGYCSFGLRGIPGNAEYRSANSCNSAKYFSEFHLEPPLWIIGIGRGLTASPLPHHRTYGSRRRRSRGMAAVPPPVRPPAHRAGRRDADRVPTRPAAACCLPRGSGRPVRGSPEMALATSRQPAQGQTPNGPRVRPGWITPPHTAVGGRRGPVPPRPRGTTPRLRCRCVAPHVWVGLPLDAISRGRPCPCPRLRLR
jgi:hypothetical protein